MQISVAGVTDPGRIRFRNEDRYLLHPPMVAVADGMGGHLVGDRAAQAAVDSLARIPWRTVSTADAASLLQRCVAEARTYIVSYVKDGVLDTTETRVNAQPGAGTTLAGALYCVGEANWTVFHIGDSRVYLWRGGELRRLTRDHSLVQELIDEGEISEAQARYHPRRSVITRAIGSYGPCSDGLSDQLDDTAIASGIVDVEAEESLNGLAFALRDVALTQGGRDNVTVALMKIGE